MQLYEENWYIPVYYTSRLLSKAEHNYSTMEREALGMIHSVTKFGHYLLGEKFTCNVDHSALLYLISKASLTGKSALPIGEKVHIPCGPLSIAVPHFQSIPNKEVGKMEFEFDIIHRPGAQHTVAYYLSQLESREAPTGVKDDFPDGRVLKIMAELGEEDDPDKWMVDMEFFLSNGVPSEEMGKEQRKRIEVRGWAYCLYHGNLYNKSADEIWRRVVRSDEQKEILWGTTTQ